VWLDEQGNAVDTSLHDDFDLNWTCVRCGATDERVLRWVGYLPAALAGTMLTIALAVPLLLIAVLVDRCASSS
jgi:hypothetical protein